MTTPILLLAGALAAAVALILGLRMDRQAFEVNLLAGLVTLVMGIGLTLLVVDRYLEARRKRRWARAYALTVRAIAIHLCEITGSLFMHYNMPFDVAEPFFAGHGDPLSPAVARAFGPMLDILREEPPATTTGESPSDAAVNYLESLRWDITEITLGLTSRVLEGPAPQGLIDELMAFDHACRELRHAIIAHQQASTQSVFPKVIELVKSGQRLHAALLTV